MRTHAGSSLSRLDLTYRLYRWCRLSGQLHRILQTIHHFSDAAFKLRILTGNLRGWIIVDIDVGIDAVAFNHPFAFCVRECRTRHEDVATIDQWPTIVDADDATPRTFADQRPKAR